MIDYSDKRLIALRQFGQRLRILRPIVKAFRWITRKGYEDAFDRTLLAEIRSNDVVWDVGANVGHYTRKFAEKVGPGGHVLAFEPAPSTLKILQSAVSQYPHVSVIAAALSNKSGHAGFMQDVDSNATSSLNLSAAAGGSSGTSSIVEVEIECGDEFSKEKCPNVIKLDVEGFEIEAIDGLRNTLKNHALRALFVEVHFLEISKRGLRNGVSLLTKSIQETGMSIHWIDPSHFVARRST